MSINIAIFASGNGSNAENIINFFKDNNNVEIKIILTNNEYAYVIERAKRLNIPCFIFNKTELKNSNIVLNKLKEYDIDFIVLAGFLLKIPENILNVFPKKIINIHPALLPKYGGKGMYGKKVHDAVIASGDEYSGITIHYVNKNYDEGDIIFQKKCEVKNNDTPETLAKRVHSLEYNFFPKVIKKVLYENF
ncbi:MAG: phosphoribosylglycinamide formyltransferase [Bacteroidales bacterium]|nr:phosphoribosylglycinamide formyltransferase [Bacteroidales bacterium]